MYSLRGCENLQRKRLTALIQWFEALRVTEQYSFCVFCYIVSCKVLLKISLKLTEADECHPA